MSPILTLLSDHHNYCDDVFAEAERAADHNEWDKCRDLTASFASALEQHFQAEESTLFPAFEDATGMHSGPTAVMRSEHAQMRELVAALQAAARSGSPADFFGTSETLLVLMEQHNRKEEGILYPMCDQSVPQPESLATQLRLSLRA